jgi:hypothetical protein
MAAWAEVQTGWPNPLRGLLCGDARIAQRAPPRSRDPLREHLQVDPA